jgi:hypothetical protein
VHNSTKSILIYSRVLRVLWVGVGSRVLKVLGLGGSEGCVASFVTAAVENEASAPYFVSFISEMDWEWGRRPFLF